MVKSTTAAALKVVQMCTGTLKGAKATATNPSIESTHAVNKTATTENEHYHLHGEN